MCSILTSDSKEIFLRDVSNEIIQGNSAVESNNEQRVVGWGMFSILTIDPRETFQNFILLLIFYNQYVPSISSRCHLPGPRQVFLIPKPEKHVRMKNSLLNLRSYLVKKYYVYILYF